MTGCALFGGVALIFLGATAWGQARLARPEPRYSGEAAASAEASARVFRGLIVGMLLLEVLYGALRRDAGALFLALALALLLASSTAKAPGARAALLWAALLPALASFYLHLCVGP